MKLTLQTHGGLAAGIRRPAKVVDSATLPKAEAEELARLLAAARTQPATVDSSRGLARDTMSYTITVDDRGQATVLSQSDTTMSQAFADLVSWLQKHSAERR